MMKSWVLVILLRLVFRFISEDVATFHVEVSENNP